MQDSIFTKILRGEIPGEVIYQDDTSAVLLTIEPFSPGHLMVIPKVQVDHLWDVDTDTYHHLFDIARQASVHLRSVYSYPRVGTVVEGFGVPHAHIHVFGLTQPLEPTLAERDARKNSGEYLTVDPTTLHAEAEKLRAVWPSAS